MEVVIDTSVLVGLLVSNDHRHIQDDVPQEAILPGEGGLNDLLMEYNRYCIHQHKLERSGKIGT